MKTSITVGNKPFLPLGGQCMNSTPYQQEDMNMFWEALDIMGGNCAEIPVFWELIEPKRGEYDFSSVDYLLQESRKHNKKLILLWFASWKNGTIRYAPSWVKQDRETYRRAKTHDGVELTVLSTECKANLDADSKAFASMMKHLKSVNTDETVIAVQVQNEAGIVGRAVRDHGAESQGLFEKPVPAALLERVRQKPDSFEYKAWQAAGARAGGSWSEVFGREGDEFFSAWTLAGYIGEIAVKGKEAYSLPMFVNIALDGSSWNRPGLNYPSGGGEAKVLEIWKAAAPHIDFIAPDIYKGNAGEYCRHCKDYARGDNPLFIPESDCRRQVANWRNIFYAMGDYGCVGYFSFGIENILTLQGELNPGYQSIVNSFQCVAKSIPLLIKHHNSGRVHSVVQQEYQSEQRIDLGKYLGLVQFEYQRVDFWHYISQNRDDAWHYVPKTPHEMGCGLIFQESENEFFVVGSGFMLTLREKDTAIPFAEDKMERCNNYILVEEGVFDNHGNWVCKRRRNGDESDSGIWVSPESSIVRFVICK